MLDKPLYERLRPETLEEILGQEHLLGKGKILSRMLKANIVKSIVLYGPPGTGKTSMAQALANTFGLPYVLLNAVEHGKKDLEKVVEKARSEEQKYLLFVDEIHRFNTAQQDYLLPFVEKQLILLVGATTGNPYHDVNKALVSRSVLLELHPLQPVHIEQGLMRAITDPVRGFGELQIQVEDEAMRHFTEACNGDLRAALNAFELAVLSTDPNEEGIIVIDLDTAENCLLQKSFSYDKNGDSHYDLLSAFQKSIRGSDAQAGILYLGYLLKAGALDDICRRLLVIADEDIGLANPELRSQVLSSVQIAERVGLKEARFTLAASVIQLCLSPKSNSAGMAIDAAMAQLEKESIGDIPSYLKDGHYAGAKKLGRSIGYQYPHDFEFAWVNQQYLPDKLKNDVYYVPKTLGHYEPQLAKYYYWIEKQKNKS